MEDNENKAKECIDEDGEFFAQRVARFFPVIMLARKGEIALSF